MKRRPVELKTIPLILATVGVRFADQDRNLNEFFQRLEAEAAGELNLPVTVSVGRDFLFVRAQQHTLAVVESLAEAFGKILKVALETLQLKDLHRVGARYVNQFRHPKGKKQRQAWQGLLSDGLLHFPGPAEFARPEECVQSMLAEYADWTLDLRHGLLRENPEEYFLDADIFSLATRPANPAQITDLLRTFQERLYELFRWSITDEYLQLLQTTEK